MKGRLGIVFLIFFLLFSLGGCLGKADNQQDLSFSRSEVVEKAADREGKAFGIEQGEKAQPGQKEAEKKAARGSKEEKEREAKKREVLPSSGVKEEKARLIITCYFGKKVLLDREVFFREGASVMEVLKANAEVKTAYGGGFVSGINGVESRKGLKSEDWFYYVNGICAEMGAVEKKVNPGDVIWWDYHSWKAGIANTAVIGAYPEPFRHGYNGKVKPVKLIFTPSCREIAEKLEAYLLGAGVKEVVREEWAGDMGVSRSVPVIIIGEWEELQKADYLNRLNQAYARNGMGFYWGEEGLYLLNYEGKKMMLHKEEAAVLGACGSGLGDTSPLWLITGTDRESIAGLVEMLAVPDKIKYMYAAAFIKGELIRLPLD
ncbi:protein of unknown function [Thermosyntropha lipolytica DSM 11003]|uniref:Transcobalamin-like C-terminal domain-containing protein n=1 Tax=Thermosyntropha lipolytica DSM 11003 TaxID=1123382 RepID=A0A1M5QEB5_9FIRM|nr:DUF4430 domain-containing protein [Thermosyntropha lipolytica]SHH11863.1 protein of unknown function [Thermosyntropha lipolytica DSM 11003]